MGRVLEGLIYEFSKEVSAAPGDSGFLRKEITAWICSRTYFDLEKIAIILR
jgi:hypothetical protein